MSTNMILVCYNVNDVDRKGQDGRLMKREGGGGEGGEGKRTRRKVTLMEGEGGGGEGK